MKSRCLWLKLNDGVGLYVLTEMLAVSYRQMKRSTCSFAFLTVSNVRIMIDYGLFIEF